jgi:LmbE family N-acetylglucosaminyl deacetylase
VSTETFRVVAVGAHPDDIELGCGGALLVHADAGHSIALVVLSTGERDEVAARRRRAEQMRAAELLGGAEVHWAGFEGGAIPSGPAVIEYIEKTLSGAGIVYGPSLQDDHQEHVKVAQATAAACRRVPRLLQYEGPSSLGFEPRAFVDVSGVLDRKVALVGAHESQVAAGRIVPEDVRIRAAYRGLEARAPQAEAFEVHRFVWDPAR